MKNGCFESFGNQVVQSVDRSVSQSAYLVSVIMFGLEGLKAWTSVSGILKS